MTNPDSMITRHCDSDTGMIQSGICQLHTSYRTQAYSAVFSTTAGTGGTSTRVPQAWAQGYWVPGTGYQVRMVPGGILLVQA
eukprot:2124400-Rhodomonas_salina.1